MNDKPRNVKNAADVGKDETDDINVMGHPERIVKQPGKPVKRVLNELDPECRDDIEAPIRLQELAMAQSRLSEAVQDHKGVKGDFMTNMGGKTDKLGGSQKNTGAGIEKFGESTSGEATDGITTKLKDLNLRTKQKNTGGTFETQNISAGSADDGITTAIKTMGAELGQNSMQKNKGGQFEPLKGSRDTMGNSVAEQWSLDNIATIMEGDSINLQDLFDSYSKNSSYVCLEDFQQLCNAHGVQTILSEQNMKALMSASRKYMFYEGNDASGRFWQPQPLSEMVGTGAVAAAPVAEDDEIPPEVDDGLAPEVDEVPEIPGEEGEIEAGIEVEEQPDDLADVFQQIGVDFERAANMMAGHDESAETPEDEAAEGDRPFDEIEGGEGEEETAECTEEVCEDAPGDEAGESAESGGLINKIASGVKGKAASVAMKGREEDEQNAVDPAKEVVKVESRHKCAKCGTTLDESGCVMCDFLRESSDIGEMNGEDAKADKNGHYTSDKTKKGQGELGKKVPPQETCESTSGAASDGITSEIPGKQTPLKPKMKNTGGQAAFKGGSGTMKENILRLSHVIKEAITRGAKKIGRAGKYTVRFGVTAEGSKAVFPTLTDALAVVEELLQVCENKAVMLEALYSIPHQKEVIYRHRLPLTKIKRRDPISCEGKILFKTGKVANAFADRVVSEGVACRVKNHNWGAAVVGTFSWPIAQRAFQTMSEAWGTQIHTPEREAFHRGHEDQWDDFGGEQGLGGEPELDDEPEYNTGAPGNIDPEGDMCPNCGSVESPDEHGMCYGCGERRAAAEPELELGAMNDQDLADTDEYLDFEQGFQPRRPMPRPMPRRV